MSVHENYGLRFENHPIYGSYLKEVRSTSSETFRLVIFLSHLKDNRNDIVNTYIPLVDESILNSEVNTIF